MGIDYSACLAYGYPAPNIDRDEHEDGWYEPHLMWAKAIDPTATGWSEAKAVCEQHPCPIASLSFGTAYAENSTHWVIGLRDHLFCADLHELARLDEVATPDPTATKAAVTTFCERVGLPIPVGVPAWHFGGYVS